MSLKEKETELGKRARCGQARNKTQISESSCSVIVDICSHPAFGFGENKESTKLEGGIKDLERATMGPSNPCSFGTNLPYGLHLHHISCLLSQHCNLQCNCSFRPLLLLLPRNKICSSSSCVVMQRKLFFFPVFQKQSPITHQIHVRQILTRRNCNISDWSQLQEEFFCVLRSP